MDPFELSVVLGEIDQTTNGIEIVGSSILSLKCESDEVYLWLCCFGEANLGIYQIFNGFFRFW